MDDYPHRDQSQTRGKETHTGTRRGVDDAVENCPAKDTYRVSYDSTESVSMAIISTLGAVSGTDPMESEPFYYSVDPDALNNLVSGANGNDLQIHLDYAGHHIVVDEEEESIVVTVDG